MDQSTGDSGDEEGIRDLELNGVVDRLVLGLEHSVKLLSLRNSSGESIKDETVREQEQKGRFFLGFIDQFPGPRKNEEKGTQTQAGTPCCLQAAS